MTETQTTLRAERNAALEHLLALRDDVTHRWVDPKDVYALTGALIITLLRTTGRCTTREGFEREARLVQHMLHQVNPDGGFYKYPTSPSNKSITRLVLGVLRLVSGDIPAPARRPAAWHRRNPALDEGALGARLEAVLSTAERFLEAGSEDGSFAFRNDHLALFEKLVLAHIDRRRAVPFLPPLEPRVYTWMQRSSWIRQGLTHLSFMTRQLLPSASVLYRRARERNAGFKPLLRWRLQRARPQVLHELSLRQLERHILDTQSAHGGWFYNVVYTAMNLMALYETGLPASHPTFERGLGYLEAHLIEAEDGGLGVNIMDSDIWDTALAITQLLEAGRLASEPEIADSLNLILDWQSDAGGFAWGVGNRIFTDNDSTSVVLLALALARPTASEALRRRLEPAISRAVDYLLAHQTRSGGWGVWEPTFKQSGPGHASFTHQALFDSPTADVTGRVLEALGACGMDASAPAVRRALRFLKSIQSENGAWWCRWWSAYVPGTNFVLKGLARLGVGYKATRRDGMVRRAVRFLERAQHEDGGWGETTEADRDPALAGRGPSTPLHTADTLAALLRSGYPRESGRIQRGFQYLLDAHVEPGVWADPQVTFTFYAGTFYYPYPMWNAILPLSALNAWAQGASRTA